MSCVCVLTASFFRISKRSRRTLASPRALLRGAARGGFSGWQRRTSALGGERFPHRRIDVNCHAIGLDPVLVRSVEVVVLPEVRCEHQRRPVQKDLVGVELCRRLAEDRTVNVRLQDLLVVRDESGDIASSKRTATWVPRRYARRSGWSQGLDVIGLFKIRNNGLKGVGRAWGVWPLQDQ